MKFVLILLACSVYTAWGALPLQEQEKKAEIFFKILSGGKGDGSIDKNAAGKEGEIYTIIIKTPNFKEIGQPNEKIDYGEFLIYVKLIKKDGKLIELLFNAIAGPDGQIDANKDDALENGVNVFLVGPFDNDGDNKINFKEFTIAFGAMAAQVAVTAEDFFKILSGGKGDGSIDAEKPGKEGAIYALIVNDLNIKQGNGKINLAQFKLYIAKLQADGKLINALFVIIGGIDGKIDINGDGPIEIGTYQFFKSFDLNNPKDGLNSNEFETGIIAVEVE